ncbi:MAG: hypothetical protein WKF67_08490 [Rubrobacteraceae bacterium]
MEKSAALEVREITHLYKSSGRGDAGVSFAVHLGEILGLMRPNGSVWVSRTEA